MAMAEYGKWLVNEMPLKEKYTKNSGIALQSHTGVSLYFPTDRLSQE